MISANLWAAFLLVFQRLNPCLALSGQGLLFSPEQRQIPFIVFALFLLCINFVIFIIAHYPSNFKSKYFLCRWAFSVSPSPSRSSCSRLPKAAAVFHSAKTSHHRSSGISLYKTLRLQGLSNRMISIIIDSCLRSSRLLHLGLQGLF